jgi:nucleotide-binding universal stress UspA family protein
MKILVGIDFADSTPKIANKVEELSKALSAKVWLLHVAEPEPDFVGYKPGPQCVRDDVARAFQREHRQIQDIADRLRKVGIDTTALLAQGATVETIIGEASKLNVDMIVVGSHGRGAMYQLIMGSVSEGVIHKSERPTLVIPTQAAPYSLATSQMSIVETTEASRSESARKLGHGPCSILTAKRVPPRGGAFWISRSQRIVPQSAPC